MTDVAVGAGAEPVEGAAGAGEAGAGAEGAAGGDRLFEAFQSFQSDVTGRLDALDSRIPEPAQEPEGGAGDEEFGFEPAFTADDYDVDGQITPEAQQRAFREMVQQGVQEAMQPHLEAQAEERRAEQADALEKKYPALADEKTASTYIAQAQQQAQRLGKPELAREPAFIEMVYLADEATKKAAAEQDAGGQEVTLERGGGAAPAGGSQGGDDTAQRITKLAARRFTVNS